MYFSDAYLCWAEAFGCFAVNILQRELYLWFISQIIAQNNITTYQILR
jgi:hypothetical protein